MHTRATVRAAVLVLAVGPLLMAGTSRAGDGSKVYWVSPTGASTWANCESAAPLSGSACCSVSTANANATAGSTVKFRGGTYTDQYVSPQKSGTSWTNQISFVAHEGEVPVLTKGTSTLHAITINGKSYIRVSGLTIRNVARFFNIYNGANYNEIAHCTMSDSDSVYEQGASCRIWSSTGGLPSSYNWIHHNTISRHGHVSSACNDVGSLMQIGVPTYDGTSNYNLVENNTFSSGGHDLLETYTMYNTVRNNVFHNEGWMTSPGGCSMPIGSNGKYGNRCIQIYDGYARAGVYNLVEGNRFGHAGSPPDDDGAHNMELTSPKNIIRYNSFFNADGSGLYFKQGASADSDNNRVYNNTFYRNGRGASSLQRWGITLYYATSGIPASTGNVIKNNLFYANASGDYTCRAGVCLDKYLLYNTFTNNYLNAMGDPLFVDPNVSDTNSATLPNLGLGRGSGAIDGGSHLTGVATSDPGNGTALFVEDALYFQDGTWGPPGKIEADRIAVGTTTNVVQIASINHSTNVITLASPISRSIGDPVWLYQRSDSSVVLKGLSSDYGASETPAVPGGLKKANP